MRIGILGEGWDYLLLRIFFARLAGIDEATVEVDRIDALLNWEQVLESIDPTLRRFYGKCCQAALIAIDNDGNRDLTITGLPEDTSHPRHWNHAPEQNTGCRHCKIDEAIERARQILTWVPRKPGGSWPIVCAVPVEAIEAWLLIANGSMLDAERRPRNGQKERLYGRPAATREDVETVGIQIVLAADLAVLRQQSRSFALFAEQVEQCGEQIRGHLNCWADGDNASV